MISYSRGVMTILDRPGLEKIACECYGATRAELHRLLPEPNRAASPRRIIHFARGYVSSMTPMTRGTFVAGSSLTALGLHALACGSAIAGVVAPPPAAPLGAAMAVTLDVNGTKRNLVLDPRMTLLDAVRDRLGLTGTKKGCDHGPAARVR